MSKGITLEVGTVVVLALDGTLVYVEGSGPTFIAVVALPEQPPEREGDRVFTPGRVGAKKISPFAQADKVVPVTDLSERNKQFIGVYEKLRAEHGPNYIDMTEAERAAMTVVKAGPKAKTPKAEKPDRAAKQAERAAAKLKRQEDKAAAKAANAAPATCAGCDAGHHLTDTGLHYEGTDESGKLWGVCAKLLAAVSKRAAKVGTPRAPREAKAPTGAAGTLTYQLTQSEDLDPITDAEKILAKAVTQKDKFKDGNRGHKVYLGLCATGGKGTVADVMAKVAEVHGETWCSDPEAIVGRALKELSKAEFGGVTQLVK